MKTLITLLTAFSALSANAADHCPVNLQLHASTLMTRSNGPLSDQSGNPMDALSEELERKGFVADPNSPVTLSLNVSLESFRDYGANSFVNVTRKATLALSRSGQSLQLGEKTSRSLVSDPESAAPALRMGKALIRNLPENCSDLIGYLNEPVAATAPVGPGVSQAALLSAVTEYVSTQRRPNVDMNEMQQVFAQTQVAACIENLNIDTGTKIVSIRAVRNIDSSWYEISTLASAPNSQISITRNLTIDQNRTTSCKTSTKNFLN